MRKIGTVYDASGNGWGVEIGVDNAGEQIVLSVGCGVLEKSVGLDRAGARALVDVLTRVIQDVFTE